MPAKPRILIAGAGPTGLTAAVELARRGFEPRIVEKRAGPSPFSRAVGILPSSMEILGPSGVAAAIRDEAIAFTRFEVFDGPRRIASFPLNFDDRARLLGLAQDRTEHHLRRAFEDLGGTVEYGTALEALTQDEGGVDVTLGDHAARFDHVIGADGAHSTVRGLLGRAFHGHDLPGDWSIADVDSPGWPDPTRFKAFLLPRGGVCVVAPLDATRFRVISSRADALAALPVPMPEPDIHREGRFTISVRQVDRYVTGRVALAGDAAHCHSPVGGRGMNLGIADAADLAWRFAREADPLAGYNAARHPEGTRVLRLSERGRRAVQARTPLGRLALTTGLRAASTVPPLARAAIRRFVMA